MTNEEAIRFGNCILMVADKKTDSVTIEFTQMALKALEQGDVLQRLRKRISDLYNTDVTYDNGDYITMDSPTLDKVLEYFDSEVQE